MHTSIISGRKPNLVKRIIIRETFERKGNIRTNRGWSLSWPSGQLSIIPTPTATIIFRARANHHQHSIIHWAHELHLAQGSHPKYLEQHFTLRIHTDTEHPIHNGLFGFRINTESECGGSDDDDDHKNGKFPPSTTEIPIIHPLVYELMIMAAGQAESLGPLKHL